jgi:hypothetical protein
MLTMPLPDNVAADKAKPVKDIVGLPLIPLPLEMLNPEVPDAISRDATVLVPVLTMIPLDAFSKLPDVPFKNKLYSP